MSFPVIGGTYSYYFDIGNDGTGSNKESKVTIRVRNDSTCPTSGTGTVAVNNKGIAVAYSSTSGENRIGIIQKYADSNSDLKDDYPNAKARFGVKRWKTGGGNDKATEIIDDSLTITSTNRSDLFKSLLNTASSSPSEDPGTPSLSTMMHDVVNYFRNSSTYKVTSSDANTFTQSPYNWANDTALACRKTFAIFITAGQGLDSDNDTHTGGELSTTCSSGTYSTDFSQNACYGYTTDLYTTGDTSGKTQNVRTYVVHTTAGITCGSGTCTHDGNACTNNEDCTNKEKLRYAATVGGGEYIEVDKPEELATKIEEAILNVLSTSASASTVATLTTQTRESSTLTQAYFYPKREGTTLKWIGYLRLLWSDSGANLREDTLNTGWLDVKNDNILSFFYDSAAVAYKARTYADADGDLKIDSASCTVTATKLNDNVLAIWNAQSKLLARTTDDRTIKVGLGNTSGEVTSSQMYDFTTAQAATVQPYWNYSSYCSNYTSRWCASDSGCNYCTTLRGTYAVDRTCGSASDCQYCNDDKTRSCTTTLTCSDGVTSCAGKNAGDVCGTGVCTGDCFSGAGTCNTGGGFFCSDGSAAACSVLDADCGTGGQCKYKCSITTTQYCSTSADCGDYRGTGFSGLVAEGGASACFTTDTCTAAAAGTCVQECDSTECAPAVIKYIRGYDNPSGSDFATTQKSGPGGTYRVRHKCPYSATDPDTSDCPSSTHICSAGECKRKCTTDSDCFYTDTTYTTRETCTGTAPNKICSSGADLTNTLKLGDIVYSTPRISPNSAVNGYDVTYTDTTYSAFINSRIRGKCNTNTTCPNTSDNTGSTDETCTSAVCTNDGYTPIVIVGGNDGMVHAFKVSKIKDFSPAEDDCGGLTGSCSGITTGNQPAAFVDKPNSALDATTNPAPPTDIGKELWSYIPYNAMPYLRWYCSKSYCHIPMVDARFTIIDASIDYDKNGTVESEATETAGGGSSTTNRCSSASTSTCDCMPLVGSACNYPWRRLLVGAMGAGGKQITVGSNTWSSSVFVLDITNSASPKLLWEKPLPDGTLTTSTPVIIRFASAATTASENENGKWYLVIGSGPTGIGTNSVTYKTGNANIYVFDLRNGDLSAEISTGVTGVAVGDLMAVDIDSDYQVDAIYFGTYGGTGTCSTTTGTTCSLDSNCPSAEWCNFNNNKFFRLGIRDDTDASTKVYQTTPSDWDIGTVVDVKRPIYASPEIASDASGDIWLYFGTGLYLSGEHATATTRSEYLYGVKETATCWKGIGATCSAYSTFLDSTNLTFTSALATELGCFCAGNLMSTISCSVAGTCTACGAGLQQVVTKVTNATLTESSGNVTACDGTADTAAITCLEAEIAASKQGWRRAISAQKMFSKPFVAGGLVDFTSFQPTSTSCSLGGSTYLWSLHYTTGTAYVQPTIFACDAITGCSTATTGLTINASVNLGTGVPPLGESLVALPLSGDTYKVITQVSGGLPGTSMAPSLPAKSGYVLWIVK